MPLSICILPLSILVEPTGLVARHPSLFSFASVEPSFSSQPSARQPVPPLLLGRTKGRTQSWLLQLLPPLLRLSSPHEMTPFLCTRNPSWGWSSVSSLRWDPSPFCPTLSVRLRPSVFPPPPRYPRCNSGVFGTILMIRHSQEIPVDQVLAQLAIRPMARLLHLRRLVPLRLCHRHPAVWLGRQLLPAGLHLGHSTLSGILRHNKGKQPGASYIEDPGLSPY